MNQTKIGSLLETLAGIAIGFVVSLVLTAVVMPAYGHQVTMGDNLQITGIFTIASIIRGYLVRRWFNARLHAVTQRIVRAVE
jgi:hypothetical protein